MSPTRGTYVDPSSGAGEATFWMYVHDPPPASQRTQRRSKSVVGSFHPPTVPTSVSPTYASPARAGACDFSGPPGRSGASGSPISAGSEMTLFVIADSSVVAP